MNYAINNEKLENSLAALLKDKPEALEFLILFGRYGNLLDDVVDEAKSSALVRDTAVAASDLYNCNYWKQWGQTLRIVEKLVANQYFDSVVWEHSRVKWHREHAKVYSHAGLLMIFAVILIEYGEKRLEQLSLEWRQYAHEIHAHDEI